MAPARMHVLRALSAFGEQWITAADTNTLPGWFKNCVKLPSARAALH